MAWQRVSVSIAGEYAEALSYALEEAGATSVEVVDDEADTAPGVTGAGADRGDLEHAAVGDDLGENLAGREPAGGVVGAAQPFHCLADRVGEELIGDRGGERERAATALPRVQVVVATAEEW